MQTPHVNGLGILLGGQLHVNGLGILLGGQLHVNGLGILLGGQPHVNGLGILLGGQLCAWIDEAGAVAAFRYAGCICVP